MPRREPFTVRLPSDLIASIRTRAHNTNVAGAAALVEAALRLYLSTTQAECERTALLSQVEQGLLEKLDKRLARAVEGLRDISAKIRV